MDCRFVYVTHDLTFAMSRQNADYIITRSPEEADSIGVESLPGSVATEVLGAATK